MNGGGFHRSFARPVRGKAVGIVGIVGQRPACLPRTGQQILKRKAALQGARELQM